MCCTKLFNLFPGTCMNCNQTKLQEEAHLYDDIVVFDFLDTYMNLTIKTVVSLNWIFKAYNTNIFLKVDDDVPLSISDVYSTLLRYIHSNRSGHPENAITGSCYSGVPVRRDLQHKWGVSRKEYSPSTYPRYCIGLSYALTRSAVSMLLNQTHNTPLIHLEDVSIGILAQKVGNTKLISIPDWTEDWQGNLNKNLIRYRKYHTIHTFQSPSHKLNKLYKSVYTWTNNNEKALTTQIYSCKHWILAEDLIHWVDSSKSGFLPDWWILFNKAFIWWVCGLLPISYRLPKRMAVFQEGRM